MQVKEIMTKDVDVINKNRTIREAAKMMKKGNFGAIPVEHNQRLQGMVTDRDIAMWVAEAGDKKASETPVSECMSEGILYCFEDEEVETVAQNMSRQQRRRFPVLNQNKKLVGIISLGDIALFEKSKSSAHDALKGVSMH